MWNDDDRKWLYEQMRKNGVNTGSYDDFSKSLDNKEDRDWYYQKSRSLGLNVGSADDFASMMVQTAQKPAPAPAPAPAQPVVKQTTGQVNPTVNTSTQPKQDEQPQKQGGWKPTWQEKMGMQMQLDETMRQVKQSQQDFNTRMENIRKGNTLGNTSEVKFNPESGKMERKYYTTHGDEVGSQWEQSHLNLKYRDEWEATTPEGQAHHRKRMEEARRRQVENLSSDIDAALTDAKGRSVKQYTDYATENPFMAAMLSTAGAASPGDMQRQTYEQVHRSEHIPTKEVKQLHNEIVELEAAQRSMRDAKRIIGEADHNAQKGTFGKWLESSFAGGAARGLGQKLFDVDTWDFGGSDLSDAGALMTALNSYDRGEELTRSQQMLLDAKAVELATDAYFGSEVGRGYKAGKVTAESIPFMLEMCINPAAGAGHSAQAMMTRYALKRFGKQSVKNNVKKYVAKVGARVAGDVAGAATMAATTGVVRTAADAIERMNGQVMYGTDAQGQSVFAGHTEGDDAATAIGKAFANTTIENYSEMVGEYFAPVLGTVGKAVRKGMGKLGLESVGKFVDDVAASDVAKMVSDFEKHSKWNGMIGEYAEEVAGGIMNALVVGDQTLDTDPETGVFNLDNNIDTFLGVSLMGGFMSGVKAAGYRAPKYRARQQMKQADEAALHEFGGNQDAWGAIRNTLAFGNDEDVKSMLAEISTSAEYSDEQKMSVLEYSEAVERYKGMLKGEKKNVSESRESTEDPAIQEEMADIAEQYGHEADTQERQDIAIELADPNNTEAQEAWNGVVQRINEDADYMVAQQQEHNKQIQHTDGYFRPAILKEKDSEGNDQLVYIVDGNVQMMPDGSMVDKDASDNIVVVYNPATGERKQIDPTADTGISSLVGATTAEQREADIERMRQEYVQSQIDEAQGTVRLAPGQQIVLPTGEEALVVATDADGENITVSLGDGTQATVQRSELQRIRDEKAMEDYRQRHGITEEPATQQPEASAPAQPQADGRVAGAPADYTTDMELTVRDEDGSEKQVMVTGRLRAVNRNGKIDYVSEENGPLVEYYVPGEKDPRRERPDTLNEKVISHVAPAKPEAETAPTATEQAPQTDEERVIRDGIAGVGEGLRDAVNEQAAGVRENDINNWLQKPSVADAMRKYGEGAQSVEEVVQRALEDNPNDETKAALGDIMRFDSSKQLVQGYISQPQPDQPAETPAQLTEQPTEEPMPVREDGEEDWQATTPERAHAYIFNEAGLSRSEGNEFIAAQTQAAQSALVKAKSAQMPRVGTSIKKYNEAKAKRQEKIDEAQRVLDYWNGVREIQNAIQREENERRAAEDAVRHDEAVAQAQADYEARKQAEAERKAVGNENPMPAITEKWNNATKVDGHRDEIMLPDGTPLKGHYVLHESGASSPSHNPETWQKTDGFPMDANDNSVNDRDYERDHDAQEHTQSIARQYDQRALQSVPVVSNDGVVLSGNGRTMAGELAARDNTDGSYVNYLKEYAPKFGFTPEQVGAMQHPRVSFVPDEAMPYTAETFAKFNQQEMKSQNKTEQAVKLGKTVSDDSFKRIVRAINGYDTLGDFYNDAASSLGAVYNLHNAGVVPQAQLAEMVDGVRGKEKLSAVGREFLENMLIGKAFESDPEVVRMLTAEPAMRQTVITALGEIVDNIALGGDWSLQGELADAVKLCFDARQGGAKYGEIVSTYARQGVLFAAPDELQTVADFNNATMLMLADVLNDKRVTLLKIAIQLYNDKARQSAAGQADLFAGGILSREDILREVINFIKKNYGKGKEIEAARAAAVERRKAESVQQDGTPPAVNGGSENTRGSGRNDTAVSAELRITDPRTMSDEERQRRGEMLRNATAIDVAPNHIVSTKDKTARKAAEEWWDDNVGDAQWYETEAGEVEINRNSIESSLAHGYGQMKLDAITSLVDGFSNAVYLGTMPDSTRQDGVLNHYFAYPINYKGKRSYVFCRALHDNNTNRLYVHEVFVEDKIKKGNTLQTAASQPHGGISLYRDILANVLLSDGEESENSATVQEKTVKVAENQEPNAVQAALAAAEQETNTEPTEAQKEAGNYKKGHVRIDGFDVTIENPKGSVRRGTDASGKQWEQEMQNTYGYIRGTEGVDGDHIDVFFSEDPSQGDVFVVDQVNGDGSFDEHKVMYGFPDIESARKAYLSNYEDGWQGLGAITPVSKEEFKKWIDSSHRKTKPFAEYSSVKAITEDVDQRRTNVNKEGLVVDAEGNPLTLYHGTPNDVEFGSLESGHVRDGEETPARFNGNGISFTPDRTVATEYATSEGGKGKVFEVNVTLKKPYFTVGVANFTPEEAAAFTDGLIAKGYDGIINYSSKWMRDAGALPSEVIVFDINGVRQNGDVKGKTDSQGKPLSDDEVTAVIDAMKAHATVAPEIEITDENWKDNIETPIGNVRMGAHQKEKLFAKGRESQYGMLVETLSNPDIVLEEKDKTENLFHERPSSYLFVKTFQKEDGSKYVHFESVTVSQKGMEVSVSSHIIRENQLKNKVKNDRLLYKATALDAPAITSAEQPIKGGSLSSKRQATNNGGELIVLSPKDKVENLPTPLSDLSSAGKVRNASASDQENGVKNGGVEDYVSMAERRVLEEEAKRNAAGFATETPDEAAAFDKRVPEMNNAELLAYIQADGNGDVNKAHHPNVYDEYDNRHGDEIMAAHDWYLDSLRENVTTLEQAEEMLANIHRDKSLLATDSRAELLGQEEALQDYIVELENREDKQVRQQKGAGASGVSSGEAALRDALVDVLSGAGVEVVTDAEEGQRVLDEANGETRLHAKKRALETVSSSRDERYQQTVVSSADGAKVLNHLDKLVSDYEENEKTHEKTFIGTVANALGAKSHNSKSEYATFETKNGRVVTIRLADHNATVSNFDNRGELDGISIVVSPKKSAGVTNDGDAHVVEYYYDAIKLRKADGKPLADIVRSIKQALYSGEFEDTTGLAERQEVNAAGIRFFRTSDGHAYGFTKDGKIYIDPRIATAETPIHEYSHLWASAFRKANPEEWANIVELMKGTTLWEEVMQRYPELKTEDEIADEVLAQYSGRRGAERLRAEQEKIAKGDGDVFEKAEAISALNRVRDALKRFWKGVADWFGIHFTSAEEVADKVLSDLLHGVNPAFAVKDGGVRYEANSEEAGIVARAKAEGTYMKAPNGKPSRLTPRQWVQVRTRAFKEWFGDWEKAARVLEVIPALKEHGFKNFDEAKAWAKEHIVRTLTDAETGGKGEIRISNNAVAKFLSESAVAKSDSKDVHLSVLKVLPDVIRESVDAEQHPDYKKGEDGSRSVGNGVNEHVTIHRLYGAVNIDGKTYRVKVTLKEDRTNNEPQKAYSYEATKIELLAGQHEEAVTSSRNSNNSITAANLLQDIEKSYGNGEKLLDCSKVVDENGEPRVVYHQTNSTIFVNRKTGENFENLGWKEKDYWQNEASEEEWNDTWEEQDFYSFDNKTHGRRSVEMPAFFFSPVYDEYHEYGDRTVEAFLNIRNPIVNPDIPNRGVTDTAGEDAMKALIERGYDGFIREYDGEVEEINAFFPSQIKSAEENVGTFDGENPDIRYQFVGEKGAAAMDKAEEANVRLDNLAVAREMEASGKDAKAVKLATGWERGGDGKWRYEIEDFDSSGLENLVREDNKKKLRLSEHRRTLLGRKWEMESEVYPDRYFDEFSDAEREQWDREHTAEIAELNDLSKEIDRLKKQEESSSIYTDLGTVVGKDHVMFKYYPELEGAVVHITDMPSSVGGNYKPGVITLNRGALYDSSILNHEVQHAIQEIEGFARGGSVSDVRKRIMKRISELDGVSEYAKEMLARQVEYQALASKLGYVYERLMKNGEDWAVRAASDNYWEAMNTLDNDENSTLENAYPKGKNASEIAKEGFNREKAIEELKRLSDYYASQISAEDMRNIKASEALSGKMDGKSDEELYLALGGEVEARNVQSRLGMTAAERRRSLASETEDVAREDQIFLEDGFGVSMSASASETDLENVNRRFNEELKTHRDYNRFVPQVRRELEKMGYRFELDGKELTPEESLALDKQNWESRDVIPGREGHTPFVSNEDIARINAKMAGKWVGEPKEAMESAMSERVTELSERLHTPVRIIRTEEEVAALPSVRQRRMKGSFNPITGEVTIVVPNNANMADIENTFVHEVVGHDGMRVLFPDEAKLNNALDELYRVSKDEIRGTIDRMAQKMYDAEVDRIREKKRKEHEARGEDVNASYYADMAEAHAEASKKREQFKRDATEEYGADLAGRIGEKGFEQMSAEELTFWGKLKAMLQKALQKLLDGLKIPGRRKWADKDWAFVLHEAYKRKKNGGKPTVFDAADTEVMRRKTGFGNMRLGEDRGSGSSRSYGGLDVEAVNERFNEQLGTLTEKNADSVVFSLGRPSVVLQSAGVKNKPMKLYGNKVMKKMRKHGFALEELRDLPRAVADPIAVFNNYGEDGNRSILTELRTQQGNFLVSVNIGKDADVDFNIVRSVFGKGDENVVDWINKGLATYINKEKALSFLSHQSAPIAATAANAGQSSESLSSASQPVQQEIDKQVLDTATKVVKDFVNPKVSDENVADEGIMFRDGDSVEYNKAMARDIYEQRVSRGMYQMQEALQDSMLGLKEAMDAILKAEGNGKTYIEDVAGYENAYLGENRLSSVNQAECTAFAQTLFKPMLEEVAKLAKTADERAELTDYMMAKHGLERNEVMARRAAEKDARSEFFAEILAAQQAVDNDPLDQDAIDALEDVKQRMQDREEELYLINRERDYAGLTALTGMDNVLDAETEAQQMVSDYERDHWVDGLWDKVNAVTKATLQKTYESGLINKATYDDISGMYENYIPLRGFDDKTSDEAYAYLTDKHSAFNAPIKTAKGRKSKADDPFANMEAMAESAIMQGNRNTLVKQKFLNFALNHPSDLVSVSDLWLWHNDVADEWQPINSGDLQGTERIEEDDSPAEVERKMRDFEYAMQQAAKNDPAHFRKQKDNPAIPYRVVESRDLRQHQVLVKRNGRDIILTINGNPRAAQALNGQTNPDNDVSGAIGAIMRLGETVNRQLSAFYTTRNPDFVVSNFMRDMMYANTMVWVKESPNYAWRFHKNVAKVNPAKMKVLLAKLRNGTLDLNDETEKMFHLFMMNGGETGYASIRDIEQRKNDIKRELKKRNGQMPIRKAWDLLGERLDEYNRAVENCARFAAFMTSRQLGRTIDRSVYDAKEISVNFNKKGSGAKFWKTNGQTGIGNVAAFTSGLGRSFYVFWNAALQGSTNFGRQFKRHPKKAIAGAAAMFLLGALMASIGGGDGDDDKDDKNDYFNLPEYVRRSNVVFRLPGMDKSWISMPLPVEYRAMYGMGELMVSAMSGKEHYTAGELAHQMASQVSQMLPIDIMEGGGGFKAFVPSAIKPIAEVIGNESWTGMPIYKDTPFNKDMPEWTKAYKSANKYLVGLSKALNEATGGDAYTSGKIDINPAQVEYLLNGIFGGVSSTIDRLTKMGETVIGDREYDPRSFLLLNRLVKNGDERTEYRAVNNEYFRIKEESEKLRTRLNHYENDTADGVFDYAEKIAWLNNSPEYRILETYEDYSGDIDDINEELKAAASDEERKKLEAELNELKKELVDAVNNIRNGKQQ